MSDPHKPDIPKHRKVLHVDLYPSSITGHIVAYCVLTWDTKNRHLVETWYEDIVPPWSPALAQLATSEEFQRASLCRKETTPQEEWDREVALWKDYLDERYKEEA